MYSTKFNCYNVNERLQVRYEDEDKRMAKVRNKYLMKVKQWRKMKVNEWLKVRYRLEDILQKWEVKGKLGSLVLGAILLQIFCAT
jgi:hypothetical protein